jgi:hypothetical protein
VFFSMTCPYPQRRINPKGTDITLELSSARRPGCHVRCMLSPKPAGSFGRRLSSWVSVSAPPYEPICQVRQTLARGISTGRRFGRSPTRRNYRGIGRRLLDGRQAVLPRRRRPAATYASS